MSVLPALALSMIGCAEPTLVGGVAPSNGDMGLSNAGGAHTPSTSPAPASSPWLWLGPLVGALATISGVLIANVFAARNTKAGIIQKTNELEITSIDKRLTGFIGPYQQLSAENLTLSRELKRKHGGDAFRTLPALLTKGWLRRLPRGDQKLVEVIVENGLKLRSMILDNSGAASAVLTPYFAAASTHFRLLDLAYSGSLEPDPARFAVYVYPRELDGVLDLERQRLERRRETLRKNPDVPHATIAELEIPPALALTT